MSDTEDLNIFKRNAGEYKINLNPTSDYIRQAAVFISKMQNIPITEAIHSVKMTLKKSKIRNPTVKYNFRDDNGDSRVEETTLTDYIKTSLDNGEVIAPSFTTYVHPSTRKSLHADFLAINIAKRKEDKHNAFKYKQLGDTDKQIYFDTMQKTRKIFNNSLSGAYASSSTILYNPSAHYTLTSTTRSVASIGNSVSESMIAGNKHFRDPEIALNYITAVIANVPINSVEYVVTKFKLYKPTPQDVLDMIIYSSKYYWRDTKAENLIYTFLTKLTPYELAAVMYVNDLWHLKKYNPEFTKEMLTSLSKKVKQGSIDHLGDLKRAPEGVTNLVHHICYSDIKGKTVDYKELVGTELLELLASTAKHVTEELLKYKRLFRVFYTTDIMPPSIAYIKDMMRDAIVLSDTDSTCGSYDKWVEWYYGAPKFSDDAIALSAAVMTINTQVIDHHLKILARNMNVSTELVELLKMKNEYFWSVFTASNVSKHYFANTLIQEGNVFNEPDLELKGVHLIASAVDQSIVKTSKTIMKEINAAISNGEKISLYKYVKQVADIERDLIKRIKSGDLNVYRKDKIKEAGAYKLEKEKSPYLHHMMWEEVFAEKYGSPGEPTYMVVKIPTILDSANKLKEYVNNIKDETIKVKLGAFLAKHNKTTMGTYRPPIAIATGKGLPEEIIDVIDIKKIVKESCNMLYIILETYGFYRKPSMFISEMGY